jgi:hypothetical protein
MSSEMPSGSLAPFLDIIIMGRLFGVFVKHGGSKLLNTKYIVERTAMAEEIVSAFKFRKVARARLAGANKVYRGCCLRLPGREDTT